MPAPKPEVWSGRGFSRPCPRLPAEILIGGDRRAPPSAPRQPGVAWGGKQSQVDVATVLPCSWPCRVPRALQGTQSA